MSARSSPKPWVKIQEAVVAATKDRNEELFGGQRPYVKIKYIVEWILERKEKYTVFKDASAGQIKVWIQYAIHKMEWKTWSGRVRSSSSVTYVVPWVEA